MEATSRAAVLRGTGSIAQDRLTIEKRPIRAPHAGEILVQIAACGVCRTDLHIVEGELPRHHPEIVPGHQVVGCVVAAGAGVMLDAGARVGLSWLGGTDGTCRFCREGRENLCDAPVFTGYDVDGGYATFALARRGLRARVAGRTRRLARRTAAVRGHHRLSRAARRGRRSR